MHFLITAGPTREYLDPVRFISNPSSGLMGLTLARAALRRGHRVTLVLGPVPARPPRKARVIRVETAEQMAQACLKVFPKVDCVIMAAAVCDYRPARTRKSKIKKGPAPTTLHLRPTIDILTQLSRRRTRQLLIGFALETDAPETRALAKLRTKKLDYIVANTPATLASDRIDATVISAAGDCEPLGSISKTRLAARLIALAEKDSDAT